MARGDLYFGADGTIRVPGCAMELSNGTLSILALASLALSILALALLVRQAARDRRRRRRAPAPVELEERVEGQARAIERLESAVRQLAVGEKRLGELAAESIRHVGLVRYDAFEDMGGRLSFSAAFLDARGDGVVVTSINGRQDTRCYAKPVRGGESPHHLSEEEREAIREAMRGRDQSRQVAGAGPRPGRRDGQDVQAG